MRKMELEIISNIVTDSIKPVILVKNGKIKKLFDLDEIGLEQYINPKTGKAVTKYSQVIYREAYLKINKPYEELKTIILNRSIPILGFAYKSKRYK
jgi:hypothetical protein